MKITKLKPDKKYKRLSWIKYCIMYVYIDRCGNFIFHHGEEEKVINISLDLNDIRGDDWVEVI